MNSLLVKNWSWKNSVVQSEGLFLALVTACYENYTFFSHFYSWPRKIRSVNKWHMKVISLMIQFQKKPICLIQSITTCRLPDFKLPILHFGSMLWINHLFCDILLVSSNEQVLRYVLQMEVIWVLLCELWLVKNLLPCAVLSMLERQNYQTLQYMLCNSSIALWTFWQFLINKFCFLQ